VDSLNNGTLSSLIVSRIALSSEYQQLITLNMKLATHFCPTPRLRMCTASSTNTPCHGGMPYKSISCTLFNAFTSPLVALLVIFVQLWELYHTSHAVQWDSKHFWYICCTYLSNWLTHSIQEANSTSTCEHILHLLWNLCSWEPSTGLDPECWSKQSSQVWGPA